MENILNFVWINTENLIDQIQYFFVVYQIDFYEL